MTEKTHWRKPYKTCYLGVVDLIAPTVLTIDRITNELDKSKKSKEYFNTVYFKEKELNGEKLLPWILNSGNARTMRGFHDNASKEFIQDWAVGYKIRLIPDASIKMKGEVTGGIVLDATLPAPPPELKAGGKGWEKAVAAYKRDGNAEAIRKHMTVPDDVIELLKEAAADVG